MKLPIPIFAKSGNIYTDVDIIKPKASVIADTRKIIDQNDTFTAIKIFLSGCIEAICNDDEKIEDKVGIKGLVSLMPYRTAEYVMIQIMILYDTDNNFVEGIYNCPRCGNKIISELINQEDIELDTRDSISNLECNLQDEPNQFFIIELQESVSLINKSTKDVLETVENMKLRYPTIQDCISASKKYSMNDSIRLQFAVYVESLIAVNGKEIDKNYRFNFGMTIFENIKDIKNDIGQINDHISRYGINPVITKICNACGKKFKTHINMSNFFVSGLAL